MRNFVHVCTIVLFTLSAIASENEGSSRVGDDFAVRAFTKEDGFKLSAEASSTLGVEYTKLVGKSPWHVPKAALVTLKLSSGVYRRYQDWNTLVLITVLKNSDDTLLISSEDLQDGDEIAIRGASFLRMTEADLNSDTLDACGH